MDDYLEKGYTHRLSPDEVLTSGPKKWYLPHFLVLNPNKPGKVRIVFDAAAEYENTSLNKNLLQGPDRTNSLVSVLMRFPERTLGLRWNLESDQLGLKVAELKKPDTMRGVLSTICTVFDLLNFTAPVMLVAKKIMQELWRKKYSWDQQLESEILQRWQC